MLNPHKTPENADWGCCTWSLFRQRFQNPRFHLFTIENGFQKDAFLQQITFVTVDERLCFRVFQSKWGPKTNLKVCLSGRKRINLGIDYDKTLLFCEICRTSLKKIRNKKLLARREELCEWYLTLSVCSAHLSPFGFFANFFFLDSTTAFAEKEGVLAVQFRWGVRPFPKETLSHSISYDRVNSSDFILRDRPLQLLNCISLHIYFSKIVAGSD